MLAAFLLQIKTQLLSHVWRSRYDIDSSVLITPVLTVPSVCPDPLLRTQADAVPRHRLRATAHRPKHIVDLNDAEFWGAWVARSVKHPTLDFGSGHDLTAHGFKPCIGLCADSMEPAWDSFSRSACSLFQKALKKNTLIFEILIS